MVFSFARDSVSLPVDFFYPSCLLKMPYSRISSCPSTSTSEDDEFTSVAPQSATQLLAIAIKKRRALAAQKNRRLHLELLHTGMIQSLCKHLGEKRASRRKRGKKRSLKGQDDCVLDSTPSPSQPPVQALTDQEPSSKRARFSEEDPFGLDHIFMDAFGRLPSGES